MDKLTLTPADTLDQTEEQILTNTPSDEALEAAGSTERGASSLRFSSMQCC
jgi:hypothetical protein